VGGTAYAVGKHAARSQQREADQDAAIYDMQQQQDQQAYAQQPTYAQPAPPPPAPAPAETNLTSELSRLSELHTAGVLNDAEFEAAKQKIISG
jgi:hypothetical protein